MFAYTCAEFATIRARVSRILRFAAYPHSARLFSRIEYAESDPSASFPSLRLFFPFRRSLSRSRLESASRRYSKPRNSRAESFPYRMLRAVLSFCLFIKSFILASHVLRVICPMSFTSSYNDCDANASKWNRCYLASSRFNFASSYIPITSNCEMKFSANT